MSALRPPPDRLTADARLALALCAVDPVGLGGLILRSGPGPGRDAALALLSGWMPADAPIRRMPPGIGDDRLLGGIDLTATLRAGRPVAQRGLIAEADGGLILVAMAERLEEGVAARLARALDEGGFRVERDGLALSQDSRFGVILLDESEPGEDGPPAGLVDRLALRVDLTRPYVAPQGEGAAAAVLPDHKRIVAARARLGRVTCDESVVEALCAAALALGIESLRAPLLAVRAARAAAALDGTDQVGQAQAELAARLVLAPRATALPAPPEDDTEQEPPPPPPPPPDDTTDPPETPDGPPEPPPPLEPEDLADVILEAAKSALPPGMLAALAAGALARKTGSRQGRAGQETRGNKRGRPVGSRRGALKPGARLHLLDTLRAAAPWQPVRARERGLEAVVAPGEAPRRLDVRPDDIRVRRLKQRAETATVFVVDASGSAAFQRLAEAKGAVERLLADCYVRRDTVAMLTFGGRGVEVALPPTRSLARAKALLAGLPGGGGTPLGAAIDAACLTALGERKRGRSALVVFLTDGRANLTSDMKPDRAAARAEAEAAGRRLAMLDLPALFLDISARPRPEAESLAKAMRARYLALPYADSRLLAEAIAAADTAERGAP